MKLVLLYTYFNGFEQFEHSFSKMNELVDDVVFCYQRISNTGNTNDVLDLELNQLDKSIHWLEYVPNLSLNTKENERIKHALMIDYARKINATHFILSAVDHVYSREAVELALSENVDVTFTRMFTYYKHDNWRVEPPEDYYMPFVHKLYNDTTIVSNVRYPVITDPSVRVNTIGTYKVYDIDECVMHHYSMVRKDIHNKFKNSASSGNWSPEKLQLFIHEYDNAKLGDSITYFKCRKLVQV
jgi:hypothetical protein